MSLHEDDLSWLRDQACNQQERDIVDRVINAIEGSTTLRDQFAMAYLTGYMTGDNPASMQKRAGYAYEMADAMLIAREQNK